MKRYVFFALGVIAVSGCNDATSSDPDQVDSFDAHVRSWRNRPASSCVEAAREAETAARIYRRTARRVRHRGTEAIEQAVSAHAALLAQHNDMVAACSPVQTFTVGGTLSGLADNNTVLLQNNGTDDLLVAANGQFTFATPLTDGVGYAVTVAAPPPDQSCTVADGSGTISGADVTTVSVECTTPPPTVQSPSNPGDLVVSEVMSNPVAVTDAAGEWFEIYNTTSTPFDLTGLVVRDDGSNEFTVNQSVLIQPGAFVVFGSNGDAATNGGATVDFVYSGFTLANSADEIELAVGTTIIDRLAYGAGFPLVAGQAMSLDPGSLDAALNDAGTNWCSAQGSMTGGDLGTPGAANPSC